jgi:hypothetical protein
MENTLANKKMFLHLYCEIGAKFCKSPKSSMYLVNEMDAFNELFIKTVALELKILDSITDEDAIAVAQCLAPNHQVKDVWIDRDRVVPTLKYSIKGNWPNAKWSKKSEPMHWLESKTSVADYLRSKSYLVGYMDLTPDQIISFGWAKTN